VTIGAVVVSLIALVLSSLVVAAPAHAGTPVEAGYRDHDYGTGTRSPTEDKPQSKVWYTDGSWWAGMFSPARSAFSIFRYNVATHTWADVGPTLDTRGRSHGDYLWHAATNTLYVASVDGDSSTGPIRVFKLSYNPSTDTYAHDAQFTSAGVVAGTGPSESVAIARDSTGQLWITYTNPVDPTGVTTTDRNVMVNRSTTAEDVWGPPFSLDRVSSDDLSSIVAFGTSIGVMWSQQNPAGNQTFFYFATHADAEANDTKWSTRQASAQGNEKFAEDHINLKLVSTASGVVLAAVKAEETGDRILLLRRNPSNGAWTRHVVVTGGFDATRPQVVVDATHSQAYVLYTFPETGRFVQSIYWKAAPLSTLNFQAYGLGAKLIADGNQNINDVSTSKLPVTSSTGLMAIAASPTSYYHGYLPLASPPPPPPPMNPFVDVTTANPFYHDILWLYHTAITAGCSPDRYCPKLSVTREQMASFLARALKLPATSRDYFTDDNTSAHQGDINRLAASGITGGCAPNRFCPKASVTREQMASFLARALKLPSTTRDFFTDDNDTPHQGDINRLAAAGITRGCTATTFCPKVEVNREQMAAFIRRAMTR
jgi:hypothetical protein